MRDKYSFKPLPDTDVPATHRAQRDDVVAVFTANKVARKGVADAAQVALGAQLPVALAVVNPKTKTKAIHRALHNYEKAHLAGGGNLVQLRAQLTARFGAAIRLAPSAAGAGEDCFITVAGLERQVGTLLLDADRFRNTGRPMLALNDVYVREGDATGRQYVLLTTANIHVKRYVTRGLSAFDAMNMTTWQPLISVLNDDNAQASEVNAPAGVSPAGAVIPAVTHKHAVAAGAPLTINQQILTHTRGWGGDKRFISTGVSNRPALSTRGEPFVSMYGVVTVDLAMVPLVNVFDVHRHDTAAVRIGLPANTVVVSGHHTNTGTVADQQYLALRDTIRTRELLIKTTVPLAAIKRASVGRVLLGLGAPSADLHNGAPAAVVPAGAVGAPAVVGTQALIDALAPAIRAGIVQQDHMSFVDPHSNRRWHFLEFNTTANLQLAKAALQPLLNTRTMVDFDKYSAVRPAGMV